MDIYEFRNTRLNGHCWIGTAQQTSQSCASADQALLSTEHRDWATDKWKIVAWLDVDGRGKRVTAVHYWLWSAFYARSIYQGSMCSYSLGVAVRRGDAGSGVALILQRRFVINRIRVLLCRATFIKTHSFPRAGKEESSLQNCFGVSNSDKYGYFGDKTDAPRKV
ncbi:hypothetical protein TNCV_2410181 [Trichonephila clavipes]|nr:hypothetical protein TNCV_2410181 [Trichonephila clavipes]